MLPSEKPPIGKTRRKRIINVPYAPNERYASAVFSGSIKANTFDPSSGGIGNKLKIARRTLSWTIFIKII